MAAFVVLLLIVAAVAGYMFFSPPWKKEAPPRGPEIKPEQLSDSPPRKPVFPKLTTIHLPVQKTEQSDYTAPPTIPETYKTRVLPNKAARLAIIIDDMGSSLTEAHSLAAIKVPLTFSIIPGLRNDKDVASYAAVHKIETLIHVPMQPKGWPAHRLEANGLLVAMADDELRERMSWFVQQFPGAVGVNNHMGSEFTEQEEKMVVVLQTLKNRNLFFIDSVTSQGSSGFRVAQRLGIKTAKRNVFLDNEQERSYILGQLNQAVMLARKNGSAIAICHPHPETIAALAAALPELAGRGIRLVPASQLVK